ncbi:MAG: RDD family protein [Defluviitaleaceae bacterium]|nr:RDD family protein [Defluviitaleaceae bacterium]
MKVIARVLAQLVDLFASIAIFVFSYMVVNPVIINFGLGVTVSAAFTLVFVFILIAIVQYFFMMEGQTLGKAFFGLKMVSTDPQRPLDTTILFQREVFLKFFSCYLICIPVLFGRQGGHEVATDTSVVWRRNA